MAWDKRVISYVTEKIGVTKDHIKYGEPYQTFYDSHGKDYYIYHVNHVIHPMKSEYMVTRCSDNKTIIVKETLESAIDYITRNLKVNKKTICRGVS